MRLLAGEGFLAQPVPALVEFSLVFVDPCLRHLVRLMGRAGREIDKEWLLRRHRLMHVQPMNGVVGKIGGQVIAIHRLAPRFGRHVVTIEARLPLVVLTGKDAVEIVESQPGGPVVERSRRAGLPDGGIVPLAERRGVVTIVAQHLGDRSSAFWPNGVVARIAGGGIHDRSESDLVIVSARQ